MKELLVVLSLGCLGSGGQGSSNVAGVMGNLAIGLTGSAVSRASGGCFAVCTGGDVCDLTTGWCEPNPCGTGCGPGKRCDGSGPVPHCVADQQPTADLRSPTLPPPPGSAP